MPYLTLGSVGKGAGKRISQLWALPLQVCKFLIGFLIVSVTHPPFAFESEPHTAFFFSDKQDMLFSMYQSKTVLNISTFCSHS